MLGWGTVRLLESGKELKVYELGDNTPQQLHLTGIRKGIERVYGLSA